ncbi:MAG: right-handed parallel beta-helix repeat-containing protein [Fibrobacteres bacterium]|nr:right-handed parallel beta-helix repeat-containing protein [Fibrobacterota bacterium]
MRREPACRSLAMARVGAAAALILSGAAVARGPVAYHLAGDGDDSRSEMQAARADSPWRSLARLDSAGLLPGDSVLLRRGDTFRSVLRAARPGTERHPIVYGAYGRGASPVVSGTALVEGWAQVHGRIFAAPAPGPVTQLFRDGKPLPIARYPNRGYLPIAAPLGDSAFRAPPLPAPALPGSRWEGAALHLRSQRFSLDARALAGYADSGIYRPDRPANYPLRAGQGFFLNGCPAALDTAWEWAPDPASGTLYLFIPPGDSATGHVFEASTRTTGFEGMGTAGIRIEGLRFFGPAGPGIQIDSATGITIRNCAILYPGGEGIGLSGSGFLLERDTVEGAVGSGIRLDGKRSRFRKNLVHGTGVPDRLGRAGFGGKCCRGNALEFYGDSVEAEGNLFIASAQCGIRFEGRYARIESNLVDSSCLLLDDAGGIYTWAGDYAKPGSTGSVIRGNSVLNTLGNAEGTGDASTSAIGIYLDDGTWGMEVSGNVVANADIGIFLHNTRNHKVTGNILFHNRDIQLYAKRDYIAEGDMYGNEARANVLCGALPGQRVREERIHGVSNPRALGAWAGNYQCGTDSAGITCALDGKIIWKGRTGQAPFLRLALAGKARAYSAGPRGLLERALPDGSPAAARLILPGAPDLLPPARAAARRGP